MLLGRHSRQGQQSEAWKRGDDFVALNEARQGQTELGELLVMRPYTAHRNEPELHEERQPSKIETIPIRTLRTGTGNK